MAASSLGLQQDQVCLRPIRSANVSSCACACAAETPGLSLPITANGAMIVIERNLALEQRINLNAVREGNPYLRKILE